MIRKEPLGSIGLLDGCSLDSREMKRPCETCVEDRRKRIGVQGRLEDADGFIDTTLTEGIAGPVNQAPKVGSGVLRMREGVSCCGEIAVMMKVNPAQGRV